jgi:hypothetical protein
MKKDNTVGYLMIGNEAGEAKVFSEEDVNQLILVTNPETLAEWREGMSLSAQPVVSNSPKT